MFRPGNSGKELWGWQDLHAYAAQYFQLPWQQSGEQIMLCLESCSTGAMHSHPMHNQSFSCSAVDESLQQGFCHACTVAVLALNLGIRVQMH